MIGTALVSLAASIPQALAQQHLRLPRESVEIDWSVLDEIDSPPPARVQLRPPPTRTAPAETVTPPPQTTAPTQSVQRKPAVDKADRKKDTKTVAKTPGKSSAADKTKIADNGAKPAAAAKAPPPPAAPSPAATPSPATAAAESSFTPPAPPPAFTDTPPPSRTATVAAAEPQRLTPPPPPVLSAPPSAVAPAPAPVPLAAPTPPAAVEAPEPPPAPPAPVVTAPAAKPVAAVPEPPPVIQAPMNAVAMTSAGPGQQLAALPPAAAPAADGRLATVAFGSGAAELPEVARAALKQVAADMKRDENVQVQLLAYASSEDEAGMMARRLSLSRALAVRSYLIEQGVRSARMHVRALGNKVPDGPPDRVDVLLVRR